MARKNDYHLRQTGQEVQDILDAVAGKADKDTEATEGHVAVFDAEGNPTDSGKSIDDISDSAYDIAVKHGYIGTEEEWLDSLKGDLIHITVVGTALRFEPGEITITNHALYL